MAILLATERLLLREFTPDDADVLAELDSDPEVMFWITGGITTPRAEIENEILPAYLAYHRRGEGVGFWAAVEAATGAFLGWFHLRPGHASPPGEVELGYRLRRAVWGRGLATEGSRALVAHGFSTLGVDRVYAETLAVNLASRRVMEKSGLHYVRTFIADWPYRIPGDEQGDVEYALTRPEWQARGHSPSRLS